MIIDPLYVCQDSAGKYTWAVDLADVLQAYAADLGVSAPTLSSSAWTVDDDDLTIAGATTYDGKPGATFSGGVAGTTYAVKLIPTLSNGDKPVVPIFVKVT